MKAKFGEAQYLTSKKLSNHPQIAKVVKNLFGYTNLGNYARFLVFRNILLKMKNLPEAPKILDIGCGYGEYTIYLKRVFPSAEIVALDVSEKRIQKVQETIEKLDLKGVRTHCGTVSTLPDTELISFFLLMFLNILTPRKCLLKMRMGG